MPNAIRPPSPDALAQGRNLGFGLGRVDQIQPSLRLRSIERSTIKEMVVLLIGKEQKRPW